MRHLDHEPDRRDRASDTATRQAPEPGKHKASITSATLTAATTKRDELKAAIAEVEKRYTDYRNIPYEADAHEVGDAAEQAFKGWP